MKITITTLLYKFIQLKKSQIEIPISIQIQLLFAELFHHDHLE